MICHVETEQAQWDAVPEEAATGAGEWDREAARGKGAGSALALPTIVSAPPAGIRCPTREVCPATR